MGIPSPWKELPNDKHQYPALFSWDSPFKDDQLWFHFSTQMSEIADLTYNVIAFSEIMQMIWKVNIYHY